MKLDPTRLALSFAISAAILWLICALLVWLFPAMMMSMSGHMVHMSTQDLVWTLTAPGVFLGLVAWVAWSALAGYIVGWTYNRLIGSGAARG